MYGKMLGQCDICNKEISHNEDVYLITVMHGIYREWQPDAKEYGVTQLKSIMGPLFVCTSCLKGLADRTKAMKAMKKEIQND